MGINCIIEQFRKKIFNEINTSGLPVGVAYLIIKEMYLMLEKEYQLSIEKEKSEMNKSIKISIDETGDMSTTEEE